MVSNEEHFVICHNGVFTLPEAIYKSLATLVTNGFVYVREDHDTLTISTTRIADGHRRLLHTRYRAPMFRMARKLAIVNLKESIKVMAV
jgi:hypothetical protein